MDRRTILLGLSGLSFASACGPGLAKSPVGGLGEFPFPVEAVEGRAVEKRMAELAAQAGVVPVVIGQPDQALRVADGGELDSRSLDEVLNAAGSIRFPEDWIAKAKADEEALAAKLAADPKYAEALADLKAQGAEPDTDGPPMGKWPASPEIIGPFDLARDLATGNYAPIVYIAKLPTTDPTTVPALLKFGGWNACPPAEYHVAALRRWRDRYGAVITTCADDLIQCRVERRPQSKSEALDLAREFYAYCPDLIDQGIPSLSELAAALMASDNWYFWWD